MALNSQQVRVAPFGHVYVAPVGTTLPTDVTTPFPAAWLELGYISEDGVAITPSVDTNDIKGWQSLAPLKTTLTGLSLELKFNALQTTRDATSLFFFGEDWTASGGTANLTMTSSPLLDERAMAIEYTDDSGNVNRLLVPRGIVTDRDDMTLKRDEAVAFGMTFRALDYNGIISVLLSNDASLVAS